MWIFHLLVMLMVIGAGYLGFTKSPILALLPFSFFGDWFYNHPRGRSFIQMTKINPNASSLLHFGLGLIPWVIYYGIGRLLGMAFH